MNNTDIFFTFTQMIAQNYKPNHELELARYNGRIYKLVMLENIIKLIVDKEDDEQMLIHSFIVKNKVSIEENGIKWDLMFFIDMVIEIMKAINKHLEVIDGK